MKNEMHDLAKYMTPDAVAECAVPMRHPLYVVLWGLTAHYKRIDFEECGPADVVGVNSLATFWHLIPERHKADLNQLLEAYEQERFA